MKPINNWQSFAFSLLCLGCFLGCNGAENDGNLEDAGTLDGGATLDAAADAQEGLPTRHFAHVPLELDPSTGKQSFTAQDIAADATMVTLHYDFFGIPWQEFAEGTTLPQAWVDEMDRHSILVTDLDMPVFLALTPLHGTRDKLAADASGTTSLSLNDAFGSSCESISSRADAALIATGYAAYVRYMVDRFQPLYLALSIEINLYEKLCPAVWASMQDLLNDVYDAERAVNPDLAIFHTMKLEDLWQAAEDTEPCFGYLTTCLDANIAKFSTLKNDIYALSTYPLVPTQNNGSLPKRWFQELADRVSVPLAVAETGYQAATIQVEIDPKTCFDALVTNPGAQTVWVERLIADANDLDMPFVTWWSNRDLMPTSVSGDCHCTDNAQPWCGFLNPFPQTLRLLYQFFGSMGLRDVDGTPRAAHAAWAAEVTSHRQP